MLQLRVRVVLNWVCVSEVRGQRRQMDSPSRSESPSRPEAFVCAGAGVNDYTRPSLRKDSVTLFLSLWKFVRRKRSRRKETMMWLSPALPLSAPVEGHRNQTCLTHWEKLNCGVSFGRVTFISMEGCQPCRFFCL